MDHKRFLTVDDYIEFENVLNGTRNDLQGLIDYTRMVNNIMELMDWYQLCDYCYEKVFENYNEDSIIINEAVISFLANTSNLVEAAKISLVDVADEEVNYREEFDIFLSEIYDESLTYRLLYHLRNYSQHGNFPVSIDECGPCFDLMQISTTFHYSFNKALNGEIKKLCEEIRVSNNEVLKIDLATTVMQHMFCVGKIYIKYLDYIQIILPNRRKVIDRTIKDNPEVLNHPKNPGNYIMFNIEEEPELMHVIDLNGNLADEVMKSRNKAVEKNKIINDNIKAIKRQKSKNIV